MFSNQERSCRFVFLLHNLNHARLLTAPAAILSDAGFATYFIHAEVTSYDATARAELDQRGFAAAESLNSYISARWRQSDVVVACNDWNRSVTSAFDTLRERNIRTVGLIEGCRFGEPRRYRRVNRILAWGPSASEYFSQPIDIVGSTTIEDALRIPPPPASPAIAINHKTHFLTDAQQGAWLNAVIEVCDDIGVPYKVSCHPNVRSLRPKETGTLEEVLAAGSILVSRPSTVVLEALVAGRAVVLFPDPEEPLVEFSEPMGAFALADSKSALKRNILSALQTQIDRKAVARFIERHVSIEERPAAARTATALASFAGYHDLIEKMQSSNHK
jgi:hypothetical protein